MLDIGFIEVGFNISWHNENDHAFISGFEHGMRNLFPNRAPETCTIQNTGGIQDLTARLILDQAFNKAGRPEIFGIIGGPPCPDFSNAGKHQGAAGKNGVLSTIYFNHIIEIRPTFFLFENVPGIVKTKRNRDYLANQLDRLQQYYYLDVELLNALDFGAPQNRNRLFVVGFCKDWVNKNGTHRPLEQSEEWLSQINAICRKRLRSHSNGHQYHQLPLANGCRVFTWPHDPRYSGARHRFNWPGTSPFGGNPPRPKNIPTDLMVWTHIGDHQNLDSYPNGKDGFQPYSDKFYSIFEGDVSGKSFKRLHRWRFSPPAAYGNNEVHLHPTKPRRLTVREAMRIQTVPDNYSLPDTMTLSQKFKAIANGVPIVLGRALAKQIAEHLAIKTPADPSDIIGM